MHLHNIRLENIRGFDELTIELDGGGQTPRFWTVLVGGNGTGKTTLLRAIALGLAPDSDANAMLAAPVGKMVTTGKMFGTIALTVSSEPRGETAVLTTIIKASGDRESIRRADLEGETVPEWARAEPFVAGYGISRLRAGREMQRGRRIFNSTQSLFDYDARLTPVELTLRQIRDHIGTTAYDSIMAGIKSVLNLPEGTEILLPTGGGVQVSGGPIDTPIPLEGWADGFRLNLAWIIDFFGTALAADALATDGVVRGMLLLDEIEQHTHPSIQDTLVTQLKTLWPQLQVVATTHSPLVVLGARPEEVAVLKRDPNGAIFQAARPSTFSGYTAEDILNDGRIFNTEARSVEETALVEEYKAIASAPADQQTPVEQERLATLAKRIRGVAAPNSAAASGARNDAPGDNGHLATRVGPVNPREEAALVDDLKRLRLKYNL